MNNHKQEGLSGVVQTALEPHERDEDEDIYRLSALVALEDSENGKNIAKVEGISSLFVIDDKGYDLQELEEALVDKDSNPTETIAGAVVAPVNATSKDLEESIKDRGSEGFSVVVTYDPSYIGRVKDNGVVVLVDTDGHEEVLSDFQYSIELGDIGEYDVAVGANYDIFEAFDEYTSTKKV